MLRSKVFTLRITIVAVFLCALGTVAAHDRSAAKVGSTVPLEAGTVLLSPTDTFLNTNKKNYSASTTLPVYTWPDNQIANAIVMKFDFSSLPAGATVTGARLHLALVESDNKPESTYTVTAHKLIGRNPNIAKATGFSADGLNGWTPNNCCSNGAPLAQADISPPYDSRAIDKTNGYKTWDITAMVQEWLLNPATNFGVVLNSDPAKPRDRYRAFASMEYPDASVHPYLEVTLTAADATPPTVAITAPAAGEVAGTVGVTATASDNVAVIGVQFQLNGAPLGPELPAPPYTFNWETTTGSDGNYLLTAVARDLLGNAAASAPVAVSVRNGVLYYAPDDTYLNLDDISRGTESMLLTYTWPDFQAANTVLMTFDLSSMPMGAVVGDATLFMALVQSDSFPEATYNVSVAKMLGRNPVIAQATGFHAAAATPWTPSTCCYNGIPLAQSDVSAPVVTQAIDKAPGFKSWTITPIVQEWLADPATNFGLALNSDASKPRDRHRFFASMQHPDPSLRPVLRITYSVSDDTTPPAIAGVNATAITGAGAIITWTTDESSTSQVEYGPTSDYGSASPLQGALATSHAVTLSGLNDATPYHFRVRSRDAAGNVSTSSDAIFTTLDGTAPSASISAPAFGATVSGTTSVTADASDNVGVAGVQFRLDGADLGAEDTSAPYSTSWNTTSVADGNHTLTAAARDAAGNITNTAAVTVNVSNAPPPPPPPPPSGAGIATSYPGDVGIESHPSVVFVERFDESSLTNLFSRWTDVKNGSSMSLSTDVPPGSPVGKSLTIPWSSGNDGGHLYRRLPQGVDDTLYVRYYVKYPSNNNYNHTGIWMGGYNPPLDWPNPQAGVKPSGSDRLIAAAEQNTMTNRFDHYTYWMGMHAGGDGSHWGNLLLNDPNVQAPTDQWMCVEQMVKLNNPVSAANGEHAIWLNGVKVSHLGQGFPNGFWSGGIFTQDPSGSPFDGFQWRNTSNLNLNWIWLQVYATSGTGNLKYAHVVAAKDYIGCLASGSPSTPPSVSVTAPATGATVSGTTSVSANAADDVGVVGVQFKLDGVNLGVEDTTAPYSVAWNTTTTPNGAHTIVAVARDAMGNTTTSSAVAVTVSNSVDLSPWPNDPPSFRTISDQPWDLLNGNGWNWMRRTASKDPNVVGDTTAPLSAINALRMVFTTDMQRDSEPSVHWIGLARPREVYSGWWMKVSANWACSPAGCGKITFLFPDDANGAGVTYSNLADAGNGQHYVNIATTWPSTGYRFWEPNVTRTIVNKAQWFRVEWYVKWESSPGAGDGVIKWWVNGVLNGDYRNVPFPAIAGFLEFQHAPTLQDVPSAEQYMYIDHTRVRTP